MKKTTADVVPEKAQPSISRVPWNPWLGLFFIVIIYYAAQVFGGLLIYIYPALKHWSQAQLHDWLRDSVTAQFFFVLLAEAFILGALYIFLKKYGCSFKTIGLKRPRWKDPLYGLLAVPVYYTIYLLVILVVSRFVPGLDVNQTQEIGFDNVQGVLALSLTFVSLVVLPPLTEEIMIRGFLYSSMKKALPTLWAVLVTSALFAIAHLPEGGAKGPLYIAALDTFILSLILIYLREKTGSLWSSITLHSVKNCVAFLSLFVFHLST